MVESRLDEPAAARLRAIPRVPPVPPVFTVEELASFTGTSEAFVRQLMQRRVIEPLYRKGAIQFGRTAALRVAFIKAAKVVFGESSRTPYELLRRAAPQLDRALDRALGASDATSADGRSALPDGVVILRGENLSIGIAVDIARLIAAAS